MTKSDIIQTILKDSNYHLALFKKKAWQNFIRNNRKRKIYVDDDIDISHLCDEVNDTEQEFER